MSKACIDRSDSWIFQHKRCPRFTKYKKYILGSHPGGGGVLPYITYTGMCRPKGS